MNNITLKLIINGVNGYWMGYRWNDNQLYILQARPETVYRMDRLKLKEYQIRKSTK